MRGDWGCKQRIEKTRKVGIMECWKNKIWNGGRLEGWKKRIRGRLEEEKKEIWNGGRMERWKSGMIEG